MGIQEVQEESSCPINNVLCCILAASVYKRYLARQECGTDFLRGAGPLRLVLGLPGPDCVPESLSHEHTHARVCTGTPDCVYDLD